VKAEGSEQKAVGRRHWEQLPIIPMLHGHRDLKVYQLAYELAMDIFQLSKQFPREEFYFFNGSDSSIFAKRRGEHR